MAADTDAYYQILKEWKDGNTVLGTPGEIHSFRDWTAELGITSSTMIYYIEYYDGSPGRDVVFQLVPTPPTSIAFTSLSDTFASYAGKSLKVLRVNVGETGIEAVTPTTPAHHITHESGGSDQISVAGLTGLLGTPQTPAAHAASHKAGGADELKIDELGAPTNNTNGNVNTSHHGFAPRSSGNPLEFLNGAGTYSVPAGSGSVSNFVELGDVPHSYTGFGGTTLSVSRKEDKIIFGNPSLPSIDMGLLFPQIRGKDYTHMDTDKDFCGADLGMTIGDFQTEFPNFYYVLHTDLGWTNGQILGLTYFAAAFNDLGFMTYDGGAGFPFHRYSLSIPAGKHWYNCELRWGQSTITCAGAFYYFGLGDTELALTHTNWKSLYGTQNDDTYIGVTPWTYAGEQGLSVYPVVLGGGYEYAHAFQLRDCCMTGTAAGNFNDSSYRECLFNYWGPGENSGPRNCLFEGSNDFGVMITGACAYGNLEGCSYFSNNIGGLGIRGVSRSTIKMDVISGDLNPVMIIAFRQGDTEFNGVPLWPCYQDGSPGGDIEVAAVKIESFACNGAFGGYTACTPNVPGKGQMLARLSGRFHFSVYGGRCTVHEGAVNSLIRVVQDATIPLDNSSINIQGLGTVRYKYWMHNTNGNVKFNLNAIDADTHGNAFYWQGNVGSGLTARDPLNGTAIGVTAATYDGYQPFSNDGAPIVWNENAAPVGQGYNNFTGVPN